MSVETIHYCDCCGKIIPFGCETIVRVSPGAMCRRTSLEVCRSCRRKILYFIRKEVVDKELDKAKNEEMDKFEFGTKLYIRNEKT